VKEEMLRRVVELVVQDLGHAKAAVRVAVKVGEEGGGESAKRGMKRRSS